MSGYTVGPRITYDDCLMAVNTLAITHALPNGGKAEDVARVWHNALEGVGPGELKRAVKRFHQVGGRFFPKPSEIREIALEYRASVIGARANTAPDDYDGPCSVCGATLRQLTPAEQGITEVYSVRLGRMVKLEESEFQPPPRYGYYHDVALHERKRRPWAGYPIPNEDGDV